MAETARATKPGQAIAVTVQAGPPPTPSLIKPGVDIFMIGGGSILVLALMHIMLKPESPDGTLAWTVYYLSFIANFPHFLASYQLLYADFGKRIFKDLKFLWAAVIAPGILIALLLTGFFMPHPNLLGYLVNSMYFFVGWHYVKQIFGGVVVSNALSGFFYNKYERWILKSNLFSLWAISFLTPNTIYGSGFMQDGIPYTSLNIPPWTLQAAFWTLGVSAVVVLIAHVLKYIRDGKIPTPMAIVCFLSIYAWYLPTFSHPMYMHLIPFFHSMQYLLFVYAFRRNKVEAHIDAPETPAGRQRFVVRHWGYLCIPILTGGVFMYFLPRWLDTQSLYSDTNMFGPTAFYFAFTWFINTHHYFIDNVIWRGNNDQMREYLFKKPRPAAA
jgi:hypothetical protein